MGRLYRVRPPNVGGLAERFHPPVSMPASSSGMARAAVGEQSVRFDVGRLEGVANRLDGGATQRLG